MNPSPMWSRRIVILVPLALASIGCGPADSDEGLPIESDDNGVLESELSESPRACGSYIFCVGMGIHKKAISPEVTWDARPSPEPLHINWYRLYEWRNSKWKNMGSAGPGKIGTLALTVLNIKGSTWYTTAVSAQRGGTEIKIDGYKCKTSASAKSFTRCLPR